MNMREILNAARREAAQVMAEHANTRIGIVRSYDKGSYAVRVEIQPNGNMTGWIPLLSPWVGNGWGMFCPPSLGDLVELEFQESDHDSAISCMRFYTDKNRPLPVASGEFWLVHKTGSSFKLQNNGKVLINGDVGIDATGPVINITATASVNVIAPAINLSAAGQTLKKMITEAFINLFNGHTHPVSGSVTSTPSQQMDAATHATSTVKGA